MPHDSTSDTDQSRLPAPDLPAQQHSRQLQQIICEAASEKQDGLDFAEFMNLALYQPGLGYYSGGLAKFGESGDFITAPEVSPLFGQCLARQIADFAESQQSELHQSGNYHLLEFGAGSGVLALAVLQQLAALNGLPARYYILELSAELRQRQQRLLREKLPSFYPHIVWVDTLEDTAAGVPTLVLANEVLDAMPVRIFRQQGGALQQLQIRCEQQRLQAGFSPADEALRDCLQQIELRSGIVFAEGYQSEIHPAITPWLQSLGRHFQQMLVLLIDYGYHESEYYHPDRSQGTLMCHYRHQAHGDFLWWPGLQDITAFVNFTEVAYGAEAAGLSVSGYTTQAAFLLANGLSELHQQQVSDDLQQQIRLAQQIKTLTLPSEMGERFKVMALAKNYDEPLRGFSMLDLRNRL